MMNFLKKNFALLLAAVLCLSMAACGGSAPETLKNIVLDDSIDGNLEDTYDEYLGYWYLEDNSYICVSENDGTYFYELYNANNDVISSGQLQYVKEYRCMYVYSEQEGIAHKCRIDRKLFGSEDDNMLYIGSFGTFGRESGYIEIIGNDWRTTGIVRDGGTITRNGEDTVVLVCVHKADATFYYDTEDQTLFDSVDYPITFEDNVWDMFKGSDFADLNGDGNSDVTMKFDDGGTEIKMVWFWDTESNQFVYQPEKSQLGEHDDGRGDLIPDDGDAVPVLMSGALPFTNMETLQSENHEDGTYYYADITEDGLLRVVNTVLLHDLTDDAQTLEDYLTGCALGLRKADTYLLQTVEKNDAYTEKMSYPVYIVTYTAGENEDTRVWTVFAMDTDRYTYLYGFDAMADAADDMKSVYQDIFAGLYLSDGK